MSKYDPLLSSKQLRAVNISMGHAIFQTAARRRLNEATFYFETEKRISPSLKESVLGLAQEAGKHTTQDHETTKYSVLKGLLGGVAVSYRALSDSDTYDSCMMTVHDTLVHITSSVSSGKLTYKQTAEDLGSKFVETYASAGPALFRLSTRPAVVESIDEQKLYAHTVGFVGSLALSRLVQYTVLGD